MLAEQSSPPTKTNLLRPATIIRLSLGLLLSGLTLWFITRNLDLQTLLTSLAQARWFPITLGLVVILLTTIAKSWRWQLMFYPPTTKTPSPRAFFAALTLGQFVNLVVPFLRLGEITRLYALHPPQSKPRTLSTLVIEKTLDIAILGLTVLLVLPFVILPDIINNQRIATITILALVLLTTLYILAYQTTLIAKLINHLASYLPHAIAHRLQHLANAGLAGLTPLRHHGLSLTIVILSAIIGLLSILTPLVLFPAFNLPFGWTEAALIHLAVTVGSVPPSTPGKIGVFEWFTVITLQSFAPLDNSLLVSYALVFHLVVIIPQLIFGFWAAITIQSPLKLTTLWSKNQ
ncbi:MAG TPA: lysylphosphatidylglycerol synthase transmembrane domain-containing protein [Anaerolineae bacterium]|nr:lysylphosphatidylglycerol synthase transmembrane domain-containing protein [Anaerolineae bacterium]